MYTSSIHNSELALPFSDFPLNYEKIPNYIEYVCPYRVFSLLNHQEKYISRGKRKLKFQGVGPGD